MHIAIAPRMIPADVTSAWQLLISNEQLGLWFAESDDVRPSGTVQFSFGDGEFVSRAVRRWEPPGDLSWSWRFLGVGPTFDIQFALRAMDGHTLLTRAIPNAAAAP